MGGGGGGCFEVQFLGGGALNYLLVEFSVFTARNSAKKQSDRSSINWHNSVIVTVRGQIVTIASTVHVLALVT